MDICIGTGKDTGIGIGTDDRVDDSLLSNTNFCLANVMHIYRPLSAKQHCSG